MQTTHKTSALQGKQEDSSVLHITDVSRGRILRTCLGYTLRYSCHSLDTIEDHKLNDLLHGNSS